MGHTDLMNTHQGFVMPGSAPELEGWRHVYSGKVRDLYEPVGAHRDGDVVLVVASDRISAYDYVLPTVIPDKGTVLTQMSLWWFDQLSTIAPTHVVSQDVPAEVAGRAILCRRLEMFPVECVVRGYLTGSGLVEYRDRGTVCDIPLPAGLLDGSKLSKPIFTPATKAAVGDHDENVSFDRVADEIGSQDAAALQELSLAVYSKAESIARGQGIILADTKFEFGRVRPGAQITLADEVLTPDSSRFWPMDTWEPGRSQESFDKQFVRNWLTSTESGWSPADGTAPPELPAEVVERTRQRYLEAYQRLTGQTLSV